MEPPQARIPTWVTAALQIAPSWFWLAAAVVLVSAIMMRYEVIPLNSAHYALKHDRWTGITWLHVQRGQWERIK